MFNKSSIIEDLAKFAETPAAGKPKVSALIITYNHEKYIAKTLDSVLMQKCDFDFEIVVGEDLSTDGTRNILLEYEKKFPDKIRLLFRNTNLGVINNLVSTYNECRGEYIAILDGDDYWTDEYKLKKQINFLNDNPQATVCFTNSVVIDQNDNLIRKDRVPEERKRNLEQSDIISGYSLPSNTVMFRKELLWEFPEEFYSVINGDIFLFSLLTNFGYAGYLNENTAAYRIHDGGVWSQKSNEYQCRNYIKTCEAMLEYFSPIYDDILTEKINACKKQLEQYKQTEEKTVQTQVLQKAADVSSEKFTDKGLWTPQTMMLQTINKWIDNIAFTAQRVLSIDNNPTIDEMLINKWPGVQICKAIYPEYDAQNLNKINSEEFDLVYSHQVLEHIPKPWIAAKEMLRVLKKGGIGIHSSCAFNPRHGLPEFNDYYRFLPDGLEQLFDGIETIHKGEWGNRQAILYNVGIDDGNGALGGRRFHKKIGEQSDGLYPWHTWIIFRKK
ncbi:MAG: glycosyltransferase [Ignavibacteriaceae bacterium]|nr:glycosyltransferase [Ignavibacteriaceae bacterium]